MLFDFGNIIVPETADTGGLLTTGDTVAQFPPGTVTYKISDDVLTTKKYVYVYAEGALTANKATYVVERGGALGGVAALAIADTAYHGYVGASPAAVTAAKYGWVQIAGPVTAMTGLTSEARTAGGEMDHTGGVLSYLASDNEGITLPSCFGSVRVANTAASTTGNIQLHGVRILPHT